MIILLESPLSPLPVPPLPHSPVGPYPPTNMYPFGIPPPRNYYGVGYVGPPSHASYRNPRAHKKSNTSLDEVMEGLQKGLRVFHSEDLWRTIDNFLDGASIGDQWDDGFWKKWKKSEILF
ncbi:hypothetical protein TNIN_289961 [Trichonephila inaurata madagascariensis]|uniref:Uncharacterized protein n=1 Tax=Trichonephila inaurata madagascariensis TaxID=2747483 RepID=A0A8X7BYE7_9ARAC|nr:hypothetical protein TNIN_289961 [Trichonephila inaurata madagascariensis]